MGKSRPFPIIWVPTRTSIFPLRKSPSISRKRFFLVIVSVSIRSIRARGSTRLTASSTRWVPSPRHRMSGAPHRVQRTGAGRCSPQRWHLSVSSERWYVIETLQWGHSSTHPHFRHCIDDE